MMLSSWVSWFSNDSHWFIMMSIRFLILVVGAIGVGDCNSVAIRVHTQTIIVVVRCLGRRFGGYTFRV